MNGPGSDPRAARPRSGSAPAADSRIIWFAFLISPVIYVLVGALVLRGRPEAPATAAWPFFLVGLLIALAAVAAPRFIPRGTPASQGGPAPGTIASWALDEAVSLVGFVGAFLGAVPLASFILFALVSMALIGLHRPQRES